MGGGGGGWLDADIHPCVERYNTVRGLDGTATGVGAKFFIRLLIKLYVVYLGPKGALFLLVCFFVYLMFISRSFEICIVL